MTSETAIDILQNANLGGILRDAANMGIEAIRMTCETYPLDLGDVVEMIGYPVWLVNVEPEDQWVRIDHVDSMAIYYSVFGDEESYCVRIRDYGKTYYACLNKPKEVEA